MCLYEDGLRAYIYPQLMEKRLVGAHGPQALEMVWTLAGSMIWASPKEDEMPHQTRSQGGVPVILDEVAEVFEKQPIRKISRMTGLNRARISSLRCGCSFHLNYDLIHALQTMGYEIRLVKIGQTGGPEK